MDQIFGLQLDENGMAVDEYAAQRSRSGALRGFIAQRPLHRRVGPRLLFILGINIEIDADVTLTQKLHELGAKFKFFIPAR